MNTPNVKELKDHDVVIVVERWRALNFSVLRPWDEFTKAVPLEVFIQDDFYDDYFNQEVLEDFWLKSKCQHLRVGLDFERI